MCEQRHPHAMHQWVFCVQWFAKIRHELVFIRDLGRVNETTDSFRQWSDRFVCSLSWGYSPEVWEHSEIAYDQLRESLSIRKHLKCHLFSKHATLSLRRNTFFFYSTFGFCTRRLYSGVKLWNPVPSAITLRCKNSDLVLFGYLKSLFHLVENASLKYGRMKS